MTEQKLLGIICDRYNTASYLSAFFLRLGSMRQFTIFDETASELLGIIKQYQTIEPFTLREDKTFKDGITYATVHAE